MTVKELIEQLKNLPQDAIVEVPDIPFGCDYFDELSETEIQFDNKHIKLGMK